VVGGGPAGSATALALARRGYAVVVIERSDFTDIRIGETLPPTIKKLLTNLGVWERFQRENHSPSFGINSAWGQADLYANDFIFNPYGSGWHVDRARFDAMLAQAAENAGVHVLRGAQLISIQETAGNGWRVEVGAEGKQLEWESQFVVDATGRASTLARKLGASRRSCDHLIGVVAFFTPDLLDHASSHATLVEAVKEGWWYSALLPDRRIVVAYMTDADIYAQRSKKSHYFWRKELQETQHTKLRLHGWTPACVPRVVSANSSRLDRVAGKNWLAIGDAAMSFDPLSSQGVYKALEAGLKGAEAIRDRISGNAEAFLKYAGQLEEHFDRYLAARAYYYGQERRWPDSLFWKRRHAPTSSIK
jgi:flavin-dependent dehydrogenase